MRYSSDRDIFLYNYNLSPFDGVFIAKISKNYLTLTLTSLKLRLHGDRVLCKSNYIFDRINQTMLGKYFMLYL